MAKDKKLDPKAKVRNRPSPIFDATHPKVTDNKDHFPIDTEARARNALARANQFKKAPSWWKGSLQELLNAVARAVKKHYKGIEVSKEATKPGKKAIAQVMEDKSFGEFDAQAPVPEEEFTSKLEHLLRLRGSEDEKFIYDAAIEELQERMDSGKGFKGWSPEDIKGLLMELGEFD